MNCPNCDATFLAGMTGGTCPFCGHPVDPDGADNSPTLSYPGETSEEVGRRWRERQEELRETVERGTHEGRDYRVVKVAAIPFRGQSNYCGYVKTGLAAHFTQDELDDRVRVHGGITYANGDEIGFDTAHGFDVNVDADGDPLPGDVNTELFRITAGDDVGIGPMSDFYSKWGPADAVAETKQLCERVARVERDEGIVWDEPDGASDREPTTDGGA